MSTPDTPRKIYLLREAPGYEQRLPGPTRIVWTIVVVVAVIALITLTAIAPPDPEIAYAPAPPPVTVRDPALASWPEPRVNESASSAQTGNVADYTF